MVHGDAKGAYGGTSNRSPARVFSYCEENSLQERLLFLKAEMVWWNKKASELGIWSYNGLWPLVCTGSGLASSKTQWAPALHWTRECWGLSFLTHKMGPVMTPASQRCWESTERRWCWKVLCNTVYWRFLLFFHELYSWRPAVDLTLQSGPFFENYQIQQKTSGSGQGAPKEVDASPDD